MHLIGNERREKGVMMSVHVSDMINARSDAIDKRLNIKGKIAEYSTGVFQTQGARYEKCRINFIFW